MMTIEKARQIWSCYDMNDDQLQEWVKLSNLAQKRCKDDDPKIPKGCTVEIDPITGKIIPDKMID